MGWVKGRKRNLMPCRFNNAAADEAAVRQVSRQGSLWTEILRADKNACSNGAGAQEG